MIMTAIPPEKRSQLAMVFACRENEPSGIMEQTPLTGDQIGGDGLEPAALN
jgi:hypothetical protein